MVEKTGKEKNILRRFWGFLKEDSWASLIVTLIIAFIIIKFIFFPVLSFFTGSELPLVIVESCSMYHSQNMSEIIKNPVYAKYDLDLEDTENWDFKNGLNKGDVIFVIGPEHIEIGEVIIFNTNTIHPIIHRVISLDPMTTKGDNNIGLLEEEKNIAGEQIIGKAVFRIPYIGWIKLIFFEPFRGEKDKGFCRK